MPYCSLYPLSSIQNFFHIQTMIFQTIYLWSRYLCSFLLLPIVIPIGRHLRKQLVRLPEAEGARQGVRGNASSTLTLLTLGESPVAGVGLDSQAQNLTPILADLLHQKTTKQITWHILAKSGLRLSQSLPLFESQLPNHVDILFVNIGANDCKDGTAISTWLKTWDHVLSTLRIRYPSALFICSGIPPFLYFPALPWPVQFFLGCRSDIMNHLLSKKIQSWEHCLFLPLQNTTNPA